MAVRAGARGRSSARSWTTSPRSPASSPTTPSWRPCPSCSCSSRSSAWSPSRTRSTSSSSRDADNAIPVELRALLRSALGSATTNTQQAATFLVIGLIGALYVSANVIGALVGGLDRVRGVRHRPWAHGKFTALVIAIATTPARGRHHARADRRLAPGRRARRAGLRQGRAQRRRPRAVPDRHDRPAAVHAGRLPLRPQRAPAADPGVASRGRRRGGHLGRDHAPVRPLHRELRLLQDGVRRPRRRRHLPHLPVPDVRGPAGGRRGQRAVVRDARAPQGGRADRPGGRRPSALRSDRRGTSRWCGWRPPGPASAPACRSAGTGGRGGCRPTCARG